MINDDDIIFYDDYVSYAYIVFFIIHMNYENLLVANFFEFMFLNNLEFQLKKLLYIFVVYIMTLSKSGLNFICVISNLYFL